LPDDLVDEGKLLLFMADEVVCRAPRTGSRVVQERRKRRETEQAGGMAKRKKLQGQRQGQGEEEVRGRSADCIVVHTLPADADADADAVDVELEAMDSGDEDRSFESSLKLQYNTVRSYVSAIQKLYDVQRTRGMNPAPRPQSVALKAMQKSILRMTWARKHSEYADRGENTIKDSYTPSQIPAHTSAVWNESKQIACALRTQVDFLLGNHMLLRSSNRRPLEFPDCFCLELPNEGIKDKDRVTRAFVVVMNRGKTNQHGRLEYGACLRHRDPLACLVGALGFWLFYRWHVEKEPFPSFSRREDWYDLKILRRSIKQPKGKKGPPVSGPDPWDQGAHGTQMY
jgi:hypothetical protein